MNSGLRYTIWQAPLFPVALAATAGIVLDRYFPSTTGQIAVLFLIASLIGWLVANLSGKHHLALIFLALTVFAFGALRHHGYRHWQQPNHIEKIAPAEPRLARLRGVVLTKPISTKPPEKRELYSHTSEPVARLVLRGTAIQHQGKWRSVSGNVQLRVPKTVSLYAGDEVEVIGQLRRPMGPGNPGEQDWAELLRDQGIGAVLNVRHSPDAVARLRPGWNLSIDGWLEPVREWARSVIKAWIPEQRQNLARALLLGEQAALEQSDWDRFQRTGVVHVLAISGYHLMVLAMFLGWMLRGLHFSQRRGAIILCLLLLGYALLTGGRPPVMRAVVMVCCFYGALLFYRVTVPPNSFALAWLLVCLWNPTTIFYAGCQLSFLAVAVLYWGASFLRREETDPLQQMIEESRPLWQRLLLSGLTKIGLVYAVTVMIWLAASPLIAARYHLASPVGLLLGPPIMFLASLALLLGFLMLVFALFLWPVSGLFGWLTDILLAICDWLVRWAENWPGAYWYVPDVPPWWLWSFYLMLLAGMMIPFLRRRWRSVGIVLSAWLCFGLALGLLPSRADGLRCTFLAVGHGGCIVLETADGRTILYDAGAITGPEVARQRIAPFLWNRGIRRIDEIFISHADLDHFNGLPDLVERFSIGQISCTPSFQQRDAPGVQFTLKALQDRRLPVRIVRAGDLLTAGDVEMQVLHPPWVGPEGNENARSLVLLIKHADHTILLTGDLEKAGLQRVLQLPPVAVDVLMAPHHGSRFANTPELAKWADPRCVISCQARPRSVQDEPNPYVQRGAIYLTTWQHGAVTLHSKEDGLWLETFRTKQRWKIR